MKLNKVEALIAKKDVDANAVMLFVKSTYKVNDLSQLNEQQADGLIEMLSKKPDRNA